MSGFVHALQTLASERLVETLGWLLLHSLWEFAVIAGVSIALLQAVQSAKARYRVLLAAMLTMLAATAATCCWMSADLAPVAFVEPGVERRGGPDSDDAPRRPASAGRFAAPASVPPNTGDSIPPSAPLGAEASAMVAAPAPVVASPPRSGAKPRGPAAPEAWRSRLSLWTRPWLPTIVGAWLTGMVVCAIRPLLGWRTVLRLRRVGTSPVASAIQALFDATAERMRVRGAVSVLQSTLVKAPVVIGYFKPIVLLPASIVGELPLRQIEAILAHELAHVRRLDYAVNIVQTMIETVFFYHPAVWWLSHQARREREHCCDDDVVRTFNNRKDYGEALLAVTRLRASGGVLALGADGSSLVTRIRRLCGVEPTRPWWSSVAALAYALALLIGAGAIAFAWQSSVGADDSEPQRFDTVALKLLDESHLSRLPKRRIDAPFVGYPGVGKEHRTLQRNSDGLFVLRDFPRGPHPLMVTDAGASGYWRHFFTVSLPGDAERIDIALGPQSAAWSRPEPESQAPQIEELTTRGDGFDVRWKVVVKLLNRAATPWKIGDLSRGSVELVGNEHRVFVPQGLLPQAGDIGPGRSHYLQLDWPQLVTKGLWVSRVGEVKAEPELPDDEQSLGFRLKLWGQTSQHFQLRRPEKILADLAAMRRAKSRIAFSRQSYFIGEHMPLNYIVKNEADTDIRVNWGGDSRSPRPLRFKIVATRNGQRVADPYPSPWCMGGMGSTQTVAPGAEYDMGELALQSYCSITAPGVYRVQAYHDLGWEANFDNENGALAPLEENRIPTARSLAPIAEAELELQLPNEEQAAGVIRRMRESFSDGYLSNKLFSSLQINAYLPALRAWIHENGGKLDRDRTDRHEQLYGRTAIVGIGGIWTPEATALLIELLGHEDKTVVRDALKQLALRMPHPSLRARRAAEQRAEDSGDETAEKLSPAERLNERRASQSWREGFRKPIFDVALQTLAAPALPAAQAGSEPIDGEEAGRQARMLAASILQSVARQDDYPKLRDVAMRVVREYRDHAAEQGAYPRPVTVTQALIPALWIAFCNGSVEYSPQQAGEFLFDTSDLNRLFADGKIDEFTTATLLSRVRTFRPAGWQAWVLERLQSDLPWMRCHMLERLPDPNAADMRSAIASNINHPFPAVQAAALTVAEGAPSDAYLPALKRAVAGGDDWIRPLAESALKACQSQPGNGARERGAAVAPRKIEAVSSWQDLLDQAPIELETGTARLGIDLHGGVGGAAMLYCLTEGYPTPSRWLGDQHIGPFQVSVRHDGESLEATRATEQGQKAVDTRDATVLFRKSIPIDREGALTIEVKNRQGATLATVKRSVSQRAPHPWMPLAPAPTGAFELDEQFDAVARLRSGTGLAFPSFDGKSPLIFQRRGERPRFATQDRLPGLTPERASLRLAAVAERLLLESPRPIALDSPHRQLLARWWVNGKPAFNREQSPLKLAEQAEQVITGKTLLMDLEIDPADLGARFGDRLELQLLYCNCGWDFVDGRLKMMNIAADDGPQLLLSNRLEIKGPRAFQQFRAVFENRFANEAQATAVVRGDGRVDFHFAAQPLLKTKAHSARFALPPPLMAEFFAALSDSEFLRATVEQQRALRTHPTTYALTLERGGETAAVDFEDGEQDELKPYRKLLHFLQRLRRQEETLQLFDAESPRRDSALLHLNNELQVLHGAKSHRAPHDPMLDWRRFAPVFRKTLASREKVEPAAFMAAARGVSYLKDERAWDDLAWHIRNPLWESGAPGAPVRDAIVDALVAYGGPRAVEILAEDTQSFHASAWGLIRCGEAAVPTIVRIIERGPGPTGQDARFETMFRAYLRHWDDLPGPVDKRVIEAVRKSLQDPAAQKFRTEYHKQFLAKVE